MSVRNVLSFHEKMLTDRLLCARIDSECRDQEPDAADATVSEIAEESGFEFSASHAREFREEYLKNADQRVKNTCDSYGNFWNGIAWYIAMAKELERRRS